MTLISSLISPFLQASSFRLFLPVSATCLCHFHVYQKEITKQPGELHYQTLRILIVEFSTVTQVLKKWFSFQQCLVKMLVQFAYTFAATVKYSLSLQLMLTCKAFGGISQPSLSSETWVFDRYFFLLPKATEWKVCNLCFSKLKKISNGHII